MSDWTQDFHIMFHKTNSIVIIESCLVLCEPITNYHLESHKIVAANQALKLFISLTCPRDNPNSSVYG